MAFIQALNWPHGCFFPEEFTESTKSQQVTSHHIWFLLEKQASNSSFKKSWYSFINCTGDPQSLWSRWQSPVNEPQERDVGNTADATRHQTPSLRGCHTSHVGKFRLTYQYTVWNHVTSCLSRSKQVASWAGERSQWATHRKETYVSLLITQPVRSLCIKLEHFSMAGSRINTTTAIFHSHL